MIRSTKKDQTAQGAHPDHAEFKDPQHHSKSPIRPGTNQVHDSETNTNQGSTTVGVSRYWTAGPSQQTPKLGERARAAGDYDERDHGDEDVVDVDDHNDTAHFYSSSARQSYPPQHAASAYPHHAYYSHHPSSYYYHPQQSGYGVHPQDPYTGAHHRGYGPNMMSPSRSAYYRSSAAPYPHHAYYYENAAYPPPPHHPGYLPAGYYGQGHSAGA